MSSKTRPVIVSVVSWLLIISSGVGLLSTPLSLKNPLTKQLLEATGTSTLVVLLLTAFSAFVNIAAGVAMLKGRRWGRRLYVISAPIILLLSTVLYGVKLVAFFLMGWVMYLVNLILLTRRASSEYFSDSVIVTEPSPDTVPGPVIGEPDTGRRAVSIILLVISGLVLTTWFMMMVPISISLIGSIVVSVVFGVISASLIVPAILLWGRKRWVGVLGTLLAAVGAMLVMMSLMFYQLSTMDAFRAQLAKVDPEMMEGLIRGSLIMGAASAIICVLMILLQRENDKQAGSTTLTT